MEDKKFLIESIEYVKIIDKSTGEVILFWDKPILLKNKSDTLENFDVSKQEGSNSNSGLQNEERKNNNV